MSNLSGITAAKPAPILKKSLKINFKDFSKAIGKAGVNLSFGKWEGLAGSAVDVLASLGLKSGLNEVAWLFLYRGFLRAIKDTVEEAFQTTPDSKDVDALHSILLLTLSRDGATLDNKFFSHPESTPLAKSVAKELALWFEAQGLKKQDAAAISERLRSYIAASLHEEWAATPGQYEALRSRIATPFTQATEREFGWLRYSAWLRRQVDQPMFFEAFSLRQIFVPPRAYYSRHVQLDPEGGQRKGDTPTEPKKERLVVDLRSELDTWIQKGDKNDAIRLVSGGPGSGKSSFAKIFAAERSNNRSVPVIFIPLHHFEPSDDLIDAIGKFVRIQNILTANPLDWELGESRLLIIFDGLDELALQGKIGEKAAQEFVREVTRKAELLNQQRLRIQIIISGRELVIQSNETYFRKEAQILHILPYYIPGPEIRDHKYIDTKKLLSIDQRQAWWERYGKISGSGYSGLPTELDKGNLTDITAQPLLNYLVALALKRGQLALSAETNLNLIYADLLRAIYERGWSSGQHAAIRGLQEQDFNRILEEIALASWHGDGRTTTVSEIESHCLQSGLNNLLDTFQRGIEVDPKSGVTQLLTAFYFRQSGYSNAGERTFEFTHKTFAEYLTARRLVREIRLINRKLEQRQNDPDDGWDSREALYRWLLIAGQTTIDEYVFNFVVGEIETVAQEALSWQKTLAQLIEFFINHGMPLERILPRQTFISECRISRNGEENMLIALNACARITKNRSKIQWPNRLSFGELLSRLVKQSNFRPPWVMKCLSYLDLHGCTLINRDLWGSNFESSDLTNANLVGADCRYAKFSNTDLRGARLVFGMFNGADFSSAILGSPSEKLRAQFISAVDSDTEYISTRTSIGGADFSNADLEGIAFIGIDIRGIDFSSSRLTGAIFDGAIITTAQRAELEKLECITTHTFLIEFPDKAEGIRIKYNPEREHSRSRYMKPQK